MKFYSEVTEEMYDTIEALQEAEKKVSANAEKDKTVDEIMTLVRQAAKLEKEALTKMRELDDKYGFGTAAKEMLERVEVPKKDEGFNEPFCMKVKVPANATSQDAFVNSLRNFLGK